MVVPLVPLRKLKLESDLGIYTYRKRVAFHTLLFWWQRRVHASERQKETFSIRAGFTQHQMHKLIDCVAG